jgi:hypothetical protein
VKPSKKLAELAFEKPSYRQIIDIGPKLSQKKDIAPALEKATQNNK